MRRAIHRCLPPLLVAFLVPATWSPFSLTPTLPVEATSLEGCLTDNLIVTWVDDGADIVDLCLQNVITDADGTVTVDVAITNKKNIAYNTSFDQAGGVSATNRGRNFFEALEEAASLNETPTALYPMIGNSPLTVRMTFPPGGRLSVTFKKLGDHPRQAVALLWFDLASIFTKVTAGIDPGKQLDNDPFVVADVSAKLLSSLENAGFDLAAFTLKLSNNDIIGALEALATTIKDAPGILAQLMDVSEDVVKEVAGDIATVLKVIDVAPYILDLTFGPGSGGFEIRHSGAASPPDTPPSPQRIALALYFPWYDQNTWSTCANYNLPAERYLSSDPATIRRQIAEGKAAGLDGFISSYVGPKGNNPTETNLQKLLDEGARQNFKIGVMLETNYGDFFQDLESQKVALRRILSTYVNHPAYLRIQGKPAIFVWRPRGIFQGDAPIDEDGPAVIGAWQALIDELDSRRTALWIAEGDYTPHLQVFDGIFPFSIAWSSDPAAQLGSYASRARAYPRKLWFAIAMPGYDDRCAGYDKTFVVERENGAYMQKTLDAALATNPGGLIIVSYNEWVEGHAVESGASWGDLYLQIIRQAIDGWRKQ